MLYCKRTLKLNAYDTQKIKNFALGIIPDAVCTQCTLDTTEEVLTDFKQAEKESRVADIEFPEKVDTFFINQVQDSTLLKLIHRFKSNLTDSAKIETLNQYVQSYGYPLWEQFFYTRLDEGFLYAIPVAKDGDKIETIWFFKVTGKRLHSFSTNRKTLSSFDWMYDYFTSKLYFKPNSEITRVNRNPQSRAIQCNDIKTGYVDENGIEHLEYRYTYCWDDGSGGGGGYVYEDDDDGGEGGNGDIDYEVAPPPDEGAGSGYFAYDEIITVDDILNNTNVQNQMANALNRMKSDLSQGRREYGFVIFYDKNSQKIYIGDLKAGKLVTNAYENGSVSVSLAPKDNGSHIPTTATAVAFHHSHTALSNFEVGLAYKPVGLSEADYINADNLQIIVIAEDYVGTIDSKNNKRVIGTGHNKHEPTALYI